MLKIYQPYMYIYTYAYVCVYIYIYNKVVILC
jgi:hypothetical protein